MIKIFLERDTWLDFVAQPELTRNEQRVLVKKKSDGKRLLGIPSLTQKDNIKTHLKEFRYCGVERIQLI
jgi:hypothetical protein